MVLGICNFRMGCLKMLRDKKTIVSMRKCETYDSPVLEILIQSMLDDICNTKELFTKGKKILIKPNLVSPVAPEKAATTHPAMVEAVVKILLAHGVEEIWIGDSGIHGTDKIFKVCGMTRIAEEHGCKICDFDNYEIDRIQNPSNVILKKIPMSKYISECDLVINMPKTKIHHAVLYTGAIKNLYGTIVGKNKMKLHANLGTKDNFENALLDLYSNINPEITIMDGIVGMEGNGPANGKPIKSNMILASTNGLALDIVAMRQIGIKVKEVGYIEKGIERGIGPKETDIKVVGDTVEKVKYDKPSGFLIKFNGWAEQVTPLIYKFFKPIPVFDNNKCVKCGICAEICPANAIVLPDIPKVDRVTCISCFCCQEACFSDAITRSDSKKKGM